MNLRNKVYLYLLGCTIYTRFGLIEALLRRVNQMKDSSLVRDKGCRSSVRMLSGFRLVLSLRLQSMWITYSLSHRKTIYLYTKGKKKLKCFRHKESIAANYGWRLNEDKQIDVRKLNTTR
ncbi:hypothetical protein P8452_21689 [Trifolium repens]|nr:hypothetical protein P8452_21689 [Trifolium repens]